VHSDPRQVHSDPRQFGVFQLPEEELVRFEMLAPPGWLQAVDHWRAKQCDIPSRDEAIRRLATLSLNLATASRGQGERIDVWDADVRRLEEQA
jgi:hypothetical protein